MRLVQAAAALVWIVYGVVIHSAPVIGANVVVSGLALVSVLRPRGNTPGTPAGTGEEQA